MEFIWKRRKDTSAKWRFNIGRCERGRLQKIFNNKRALVDPGSKIPVLRFVTRVSISLDWPLGRFDRRSRVNDIVLREPLCRSFHQPREFTNYTRFRIDGRPSFVYKPGLSPISKCSQRNVLHVQSAFQFHNYQTFIL